MRIITLNVNGLRSAAAKGFGPWMRRRNPDIDAQGRFLLRMRALSDAPPC